MVDFKAILRGGVGALLSLIYPPHCGACGCRLPGESFLCAACYSAIPRIPEPSCLVCSHPLKGAMPCPNCEGRQWHLSFIVSGCRHEGVARDLVHRFKYGRDQSLTPLLADLMLPALDDPRIQGRKFDCLVPVPLHHVREREREFNQAALLATRLAKIRGTPALHLLKRVRPTPPQAGAERAERLKNLEGAFAMRKPIREGMRILLVDDVTTTGATLDACAAVLMGAGASEVCAITVARG